MNALRHKVVFSGRLGAMVAVAENTAAHGKGARCAVACGAALTLSAFTAALGWQSACAAELAATALPGGGVVATGSASIGSNAATMNIHQSSDKASINWSSFNVGSAARVNIVQPGASSVLLNRVVGSDPSQIMGSITANGQVMLVNPNGVVFGKGGSVTATSFTASTLGISDADFQAGNYRFTRNGGTAGVVNQGTITTNGGYVALLGASVSNEGKIVTKGGDVVMAAGNSATISIPVSRGGKVRLVMTAADINTAVSNTADGIVQTEGGQVLMQAASVADVLAGMNNPATASPLATITQSGTIDTTGVQGGAVTLRADGGNITVDGKITANSTGVDNNQVNTKGGDIIIGRALDDSGNAVLAATTDVSGASLESKGGFVETSADTLQFSGAQVRAKDWLLDPDNVVIDAAAASTIGTALATGNVTVSTTTGSAYGTRTTGDGNITVSSAITKASGSADTTLTLIADNGIDVNANIGASGTGTGKLNLSLTANGLSATASKGLTVATGVTVDGNGGNVSMSGSSSGTVYGLYLAGTVKGGTVALTGANRSSTYTGLKMDNGTVTSSGNITISGTGGGADVQGTVESTDLGSTIAITGNSAYSSQGGVVLRGGSLKTNAGKTTVVGTSTVTPSTSSQGVLVGYLPVTWTGDLELTGTSSKSTGVVASMALTGTGKLTMNGTTTGAARAVRVNSTVTAGGDIEINGTNNGPASSTIAAVEIYVLSGVTSFAVTSTSGSITLNGSSTTGTTTDVAVGVNSPSASAPTVTLSAAKAINIVADTFGVGANGDKLVAPTINFVTKTTGNQIKVGAASTGDATANARILGIDAKALSAINTGTLGTLNIGSSSSTGQVTVDTATLNPASAINIYSGSDIALAGNLTTNAATTALTLNAGGAVTGAGNLAWGNTTGGTITVNSATDGTLSGVVSGAASLVKQGAGTTTLTGTNSYSGTTTISGGTLQIGSGGTTGTLGTGAVVLSNNANLSYVRSAATSIGNSISGSGNVSATITGAGNGLTVSSPIDLTSGNVNLVTAGTLTTTKAINATNIQLTGSQVAVNGTGATNLIKATGTLGIGASNTAASGSAVSLASGAQLQAGGDLTVSGTNTNASNTSAAVLIAGNTLTSTNGAVLVNTGATSTGGISVTGATTLSAASGSTLTATTSKGQGFANTAAGTINATGALTINGTSSSASGEGVAQDGAVSATGNLTITGKANGGIGFRKAQALASSGGGSINLTGTTVSGARGIQLTNGVVTTTGTTKLTGTNSGANYGIFLKASTLSATGNLELVGNGSNGIDFDTLSHTGIESTQGSVKITANMLGVNKVSALGDITIESTAGPATIVGQVTSGQGSIYLSAKKSAYAGDLAVYTNLKVNGTNSINLKTDNLTTYSGSIDAGSDGTVNINTMTVGNSINLGSSSASGVLGLNAATLNAINAGTLNIGSSTSGPVTVSGATLSGTNVASNINITSGSNIALAGDLTTNAATKALALNAGGAVVGAGNLNITNTGSTVTLNAATDATLSGVISGGTALDKQGAGTITLTGNNTYTGTTTISGGTLQVGNGGTTGTLGNGGAVVLSNNATLSYVRSTSTSISNSISGSGNVLANITGAVSGTNNALTVDNAINLTGGTVNLAADGNVQLNQSIATTNTGSSAVVLAAGQGTAAGTASGGNVSIASGKSITVGAGGRATVFTGSVAGSSGITDLVGAGSGNFRYNSSKSVANYNTDTAALGAGLYAVYRESPTITATLNDAAKTYDGLAWAGGNGMGAYSGGVNGDTNTQLQSTSNLGWGGDAQGAKNAGTYTISGTATSALGYTVVLNPGTLSVAKANLTTVTATKTYDGLGTVTAAQMGSIVGVAGETFTASAGTAAILGKNVATANNTLTDLSGLTLDSSNGGNADNYNLATGLPAAGANNVVTINKASATVTANSATTTYNAATQSVSGFTIQGLAGSDTVADLGGITASGSGRNAGTWASKASGIDSNYNLTFVDGSLVINKASATVTANSATTTYNAATQSVSGFTAQGLAGTDTVAELSGVTASGSGRNAGTWASKASGADSNYNLTFVNGSLVIEKASATVTANSATTTYNAATQSVSGFGIQGLLGSDTVANLSGITASGSGRNAGTWASKASGIDSNYNLTFVDGSLVINKASATVTASSATTTYNAATQTVSGFGVQGLLGSDTAADLTGISAIGSGRNVGTYVSKASASGSNGNYNLTFVDGNLVIEKAALTVVPVVGSGMVSSTTISEGKPTVSGLLGPDKITKEPTQSYNSIVQGMAGTITASGLEVDDGNGGANYRVNYVPLLDVKVTSADAIYPTLPTVKPESRVVMRVLGPSAFTRISDADVPPENQGGAPWANASAPLADDQENAPALAGQ